MGQRLGCPQSSVFDGIDLAWQEELAAAAPAEEREKASTPTQQSCSAQLGSGATEAARHSSLAAAAAAAQVAAFLDVDAWLMIGGAHAAVRNAQVPALLQECRDMCIS